MFVLKRCTLATQIHKRRFKDFWQIQMQETVNNKVKITWTAARHIILSNPL